MNKPILENEIEVRISGTATVENNINEVKEYALNLKNYYSKLVFTEEQASDAKSERASINKIIKKVADYRKNTVAEFKKPIEEFESIAKETEKILKETADFVDVQVKNFENKEKEDKKKEIEAMYKYLIDQYPINNLITFETIFDERYLNKTFENHKISEDIKTKLEQISNDIQAIKDLNSEYEVSLINTYLKDFNLSNVISENKRLQELKKETTKVEERKEEIKEEKVNEMLSKPVIEENIDPIKTYTLKITGPLSKQNKLRQFLDLNGMTYSKVEVKELTSKIEELTVENADLKNQLENFQETVTD